MPYKSFGVVLVLIFAYSLGQVNKQILKQGLLRKIYKACLSINKVKE